MLSVMLLAATLCLSPTKSRHAHTPRDPHAYSTTAKTLERYVGGATRQAPGRPNGACVLPPAMGLSLLAPVMHLLLAYLMPFLPKPHAPPRRTCVKYLCMVMVMMAGVSKRGAVRVCHGGM